MDFSGNVKNPFLFDDPAPPADVGDSAANPFLMGGAFDYSSVSYTGINPFSDQIDDSNAAAAGLFGEPAAYPSDMNPFGVATQPFGDVAKEPDFFGTPVSQVSGDLFGGPPESDSTQPAKPLSQVPPTRPPAPCSPVADLMNDSLSAENTAVAPGRPPPPRPPPPSKETKDLLQTVIGAMEATTDTLHEKLTTTRTPCPSPGSGAPTSRSPTPDIQITSPKKDSDAFSAIFGQTIDMDSDHEIEEGKPTTNTDAAQPTSTSDDFDLFGDAPVQKPRTNQDILSLFNKPQPSHSPQVDLLSDDLPESNITADNEETDKQSISDLLSGASVEDSQPKITPDEEVPAVPAAPSLSEEITVNDATATITETPLTSDGTSDVIPLEESVSPEQVSEKTDSEPTVIEAPDQDTGEEVCKISAAASDVPEVSSVEEKIEAMEVFGSPEPVPPTVNSEHSTSPGSSHLSTPVKTVPPEPSVSAEDQSKSEGDDAFGISEMPTSQGGAVDGSFGDSDAFGSIPDTFGTSAQPDTGSTLFADSSGPFDNSIPTGDALFGDTSSANLFGDLPQSAHPDSPAAGLFGDVSQVAPPASPANSLFSEVGQSAPPASPAAGLFGNNSGSSAFDVFGSSTAPVPVPSGADSTGAALFGSAAPAPNVGMSLFGAGAEPSLDIFAESEGNTMVNPFAQPTPTPTSVLGATPSTVADSVKVATDEEFDAFSARFDSAANEGEDELQHDPFASTARGKSRISYYKFKEKIQQY